MLEQTRLVARDDAPASAGRGHRLHVGDQLTVSFYRAYEKQQDYILQTGDKLTLVVDAKTHASYQIKPGDIIEVDVISRASQREYRIQPGDKIEVVVPNQDNLGTRTMVLADGTVTLNRIGHIRLGGLTIEEGIVLLNKEFQSFLDKPSVDLLVTESPGDRISTKVTVLPDGTASLPVVGSIAFAGHNIDQVRDELADKYAEICPEPQVDLNITSDETAGFREELTVLPNGSVVVPLLGQVSMRGHTVAEVRKRLEAQYGKKLRYEPAVDLLIQAADQRTENFFNLWEGNLPLAIRVDQDGLLDLPVIGPVEAADLKLHEVRTKINRAYRQKLPGIQATLTQNSFLNLRFLVLGEVRQSGIYEYDPGTTVFMGLAKAGGMLDTAWRQQVILARVQEDGNLRLRPLDLDERQLIETGEGWTTAMQPGDVIYVPKSEIADVNVWWNQHVQSMLPNIGFGFGYTLND